MRQVALGWAGLLLLAFGVTFLARVAPASTTIPNSQLAFDQPGFWHAFDKQRVLDPSWATEQKRQYPAHAALIDSAVDGFRSGRTTYMAWIDLDLDHSTAEGWVDASVSQSTVAQSALTAYALETVSRQPVAVHPGSTAIEVALQAGPAVRLDWSYDLRAADGTSEVVRVRTYWLAHDGSLVGVQLTTYGPHPDAVAAFDAVATTFRWSD